MKLIKRGVHKLTQGRFTFDKLAVIMLAVLSISLVGKGYESTEERIALAGDGREVTSVEDVEIPILVNSEEEGLEGSVLTISSSGVSSSEEDSGSTQETRELNLEGLEEYQVSFINKIVPVAVEVAREYNVYPSIVVAQSILESGWGRSPLAVNANNLFGIKGTYNGSFIWHDTKEDDGTGFQYKVTDKFAKYPSYKESVESNARLIREGLSWDSEYYSGAWVENTKNYQEATEFLTGTYATDINYNSKINGVIQEYNLDVLDK